MKREARRWSLCMLLCSLLALGACSKDPEPALADNPLCAFDCPKRGVAEGNSAISGVPSADTFFQAAVAYSAAADYASAAIETELSQLRTDFGVSATEPIGAAIRSQGADVLGKSPSVVAGQALCWVDSVLLLNAQGQCDAELEATTIDCRGACRVEPGTDCNVSAELQCTQNIAAAACAQECTGTCTGAPDPGGACDGVCLGSCDARCDKFAAKGDGVECAGRCSGRCAGQCVRPVERQSCNGMCNGACTLIAPAECDDAIEVRCQSKSGRKFDCPGSCGGVVDAPLGNAECRAAAQAQASYLARCDAPHVSIVRAPASASPDDRERRYLQSLRDLELRMPELLAGVAHAELIKTAGQKLAATSGTDVDKSLTTASEAAELPIQTGAGLACAIAEVPRIAKALEPADRRLNIALTDANELLGAFDID